MIAYADTSWWVAFKNTGDSQHEIAVSLWDFSDDISVIWTPWQRVEVFNAIRQVEKLGFMRAVRSGVVIRNLEREIRLGYWPHVEFAWPDAIRTANEISAEHSRSLCIRAMDLFHVAIACEVGAERFLTFDEDQAALASVAGLQVWRGGR